MTEVTLLINAMVWGLETWLLLLKREDLSPDLGTHGKSQAWPWMRL